MHGHCCDNELWVQTLYDMQFRELSTLSHFTVSNKNIFLYFNVLFAFKSLFNQMPSATTFVKQQDTVN